MTVDLPFFVQAHQSSDHLVKQELIEGLLQHPASISPKFFYDPLGSKLFTAITELSEYYPTRTEARIFTAHGADMAQHLPAHAIMIDLGAGCCSKAAKLFPLLKPSTYVAVDIAVDFLRDTLGALANQHPDLHMMGVGLDFSNTLEMPSEANAWLQQQHHHRQPRVVFYPGSSIGNFAPDHALQLLQQAHALCFEGGAGGGVLIGVDLLKSASVLEPAYDDSLGVTAAFNRNVLLHCNQLLGSDFNPRLWQHVALFNHEASRIEMHLQSTCLQTVKWPNGQRLFEEGERIHTENAYKWTPPAFERLLQQAGFTPRMRWFDEKAWFGVFWAEAA
jgi:L-histidine N-alpha-methyltransferase